MEENEVKVDTRSNVQKVHDFLNEYTEPVTAKEICEFLDLTGGQVSASLYAIKEKGVFITKHKDANDKTLKYEIEDEQIIDDLLEDMEPEPEVETQPKVEEKSETAKLAEIRKDAAIPQGFSQQKIDRCLSLISAYDQCGIDVVMDCFRLSEEEALHLIRIIAGRYNRLIKIVTTIEYIGDR